MFNFDRELLQLAALTIMLELPVFYFCGYRKIEQLSAFVLVNLISNLLLNEALRLCSTESIYWCSVVVGEILVVILEYILMFHIISTAKKKLFCTVCLTNATSLVLGLLLQFYC